MARRVNTQNIGTITSKFGTSGRINHDSSNFYDSKLYKTLESGTIINSYIENSLPETSLNKIFPHTSEDMYELPDCSIHLMITSPPYNVGKVYDNDLSLEEYRTILRNVWEETYRVLVPGGRVAINIANLGRKPYIPLHSYIIEDMLKIGYLMRGEVIWNKGASGSPSTAWGSWLSASNPTLRDIHEYILIFSKGNYSLKNPNKKKNSITKEQFLEYTKSVWNFSAVSARKIGHPAPFPIELPNRLIQLYSYENCVILDPFMGSGQTAISAISNKRYYIGYEVDKTYIILANKRIEEEQLKNCNQNLFEENT